MSTFRPLTVNMSVIDELTSLAARGRETRAVNDVVQPSLKHEQEVLARNAFLVKGFFEIVAELLFENEVNALYFLLFAKLLAVTGEASCGGQHRAVPAGWYRAFR